MDLKEYFEKADGFSVLSTADKNGVVNAAVYSRPHVMDDGSLALIMNNKLSLSNVRENSKAHFLFREDGSGYKGVRLSLTMVREEQGSELLESLCRRCHSSEGKDDKERSLVFFHVDENRPLIGGGR